MRFLFCGVGGCNVSFLFVFDDVVLEEEEVDLGAGRDRVFLEEVLEGLGRDGEEVVLAVREVEGEEGTGSFLMRRSGFWRVLPKKDMLMS